MSDAANPLLLSLSVLANEVTRRALATDPDMRSKLQPLQERCAEINATLPAMTAHLVVRADGIEVYPGPAAQPDAIVTGSLGALGAWLLPRGNGDVQVDGDETFLLQLRQILSQFRPDPTAPLAQLLGDETASTLLGTAELGLDTLRSLLDGVGSSIGAQAANRFVARPALEPLLRGIDDLRLRVDRLAAGVARQEQLRRRDAS